MNAPMIHLDTMSTPVSAAIESAIDAIAPTWPLDQMIAVNPYWGRIHQPFEEARNALAKIAGSPMALPLSWYREAWQRGEITRAELEQAVSEMNSSVTPQQLLAALETEQNPPTPAPLLCDTLDSLRDLRHEPAWCDTITHQVAQFCGAFFDGDQADWRPTPVDGLYTSWRSALTRDHSVALLMKAPDIPVKAAGLSEDPEQQIARALATLSVPESDWPDYLQAVMMRVSGWAAWCAYLRWQARLREADDRTAVDLLAMRLSWECLLDDGQRQPGSVWARWQSDWQKHVRSGDDLSLQVQSGWQRAEEISHQNALLQKLRCGGADRCQTLGVGGSAAARGPHPAASGLPVSSGCPSATRPWEPPPADPSCPGCWRRRWLQPTAPQTARQRSGLFGNGTAGCAACGAGPPSSHRPCRPSRWWKPWAWATWANW